MAKFQLKDPPTIRKQLKVRERWKMGENRGSIAKMRLQNEIQGWQEKEQGRSLEILDKEQHNCRWVRN